MKSIVRSLILVLIAAAVGSGCTTTQPPRISVMRAYDTLVVLLDAETSARWSPTRDSLVVVCENCEVGYTRLVEHFEQDDVAALEVSPYERLRLSLYSRGLDTVIILEPLLAADPTKATERKRIVKRSTPPKRQSVRADAKKDTRKEVVKKEEVKKEAPKKEEVKKRATSVRVSAAEGVAVYKDKSKKEVIKIIPKGQSLPYIAKEGSMISVTVDGQEGFVESEAVKVED